MRKGVWFIILGVIFLLAAGFLAWKYLLIEPDPVPIDAPVYTLEEIKSSDVVEQTKTYSSGTTVVVIKGEVTGITGQNITIGNLTVFIGNNCDFWIGGTNSSNPPRKLNAAAIVGSGQDARIETPGDNPIKLFGLKVTIFAEFKEGTALVVERLTVGNIGVILT